jgi:hypothetical protein
MSTDWIEVHDHKSTYNAKIFLTDRDDAYMITSKDEKKQFFRINTKLLKLGEIEFFENVMTSAKEISESQFPLDDLAIFS